MGSCPFWFPAILANKYCCCVLIYKKSDLMKIGSGRGNGEKVMKKFKKNT